MDLKALRAVLYQLESGTRYVFVDALTIQPAGANFWPRRRGSDVADDFEFARALAERHVMKSSRWPAACFGLLLWLSAIAAVAGEQERPEAALTNPVAAQSLD